MGTTPGVTNAREQLRNFVDRGGFDPARFAHLPVAADARPAAVLVLFGALDDVPASRPDAPGPVSHDLDVLLLARARTLRSHPGQIAFPGGRADDGDATLSETALREAQEETGLDPSGIDVLGELPALPLAHSRHLVTPVIAWWERQSPVRVVDHAESAQVFRIPVADLVDPAHRVTSVLRRNGMTFKGPAFRVLRGEQTRLLWGFTAIVLDALFTELGWDEPWDRSHHVAVPTNAAGVRPDATLA